MSASRAERIAALRDQLETLKAADADDQTSVEYHEYLEVRKALRDLEGTPARDNVAVVLNGLGFFYEMTGGNCTAYLRDNGTTTTYVTLHDDPTAPVSFDEAVDVGTYANEGGALSGQLHHYATLAEAVLWLNTGEY